MKKLLWLLILLMAITACAPSESVIQTAIALTIEAIPTASPYPTYTSPPPVIIVVTATPLPQTPTPSNTPTITPTPTKTSTPLPTLDPLKSNHHDGNYLVGVDIAPGVWRSEAGWDDCYWEIDTMKGDIINNYFGTSGGTMYLAPSYFEVRMEDCGAWTFLSNP